MSDGCTFAINIHLGREKDEKKEKLLKSSLDSEGKPKDLKISTLSNDGSDVRSTSVLHLKMSIDMALRSVPARIQVTF